MTTINKLTEVDSVEGGDQLAVYKTKNGSARRVSFTTAEKYFREKFGVANKAALEIPRRGGGFNYSTNGTYVRWYDGADADNPERVPARLNGSTIIAPTDLYTLFSIPASPSFSKINIYLQATVQASSGIPAIAIFKNDAQLTHNNRVEKIATNTSSYSPLKFYIKELPISAGDVFKLRFLWSNDAVSSGITFVSTDTTAPTDYCRVEEVVS